MGSDNKLQMLIQRKKKLEKQIANAPRENQSRARAVTPQQVNATNTHASNVSELETVKEAIIANAEAGLTDREKKSRKKKAVASSRNKTPGAKRK